MNNNLNEIIQEIYNNLLSVTEGKVADYIPELGNVNPDKFSISLCRVNGERINVGDYKDYFCLQSCSKPLSYCIAHDLMGRNKLHQHVGYEPSGQEFNAFILNKQGLPHNPMINSGAIMVASQIERNKEPSERFNIIKTYYSKMCGNIGKVGFDNSVFLSEQHNADRNISLAYYMRQNGAFGKEHITPNEITESLNLYFQQCSTTINSEMGSVIAATLANGGINPITSDRVVSTDSVKDCLTLMYGCGMYDYSGQFSFEIGLPAKSGVSGCVLLVVPNKFGVCIWSPPLDEQGNSVKGIEFCKLINEKLNLHIFDNIIKSRINLSDSISSNFIKMCHEGDIDGVKNMLISNKGMNLNTGDYDKRTPLHLASAEGHYEIVKLLLDNGAEITKDRWSNTPINELENKDDDDSKILLELFKKYLN